MEALQSLHHFDMSVPPGTWVGTEVDAIKWRDYMLARAKERGALGLDSETTGLVKFKDRVVIWSLSDGKYRLCIPSRFIPIFKKEILENPEVNFDLTNAKYDAHMFANSGADISKAGEWHCTVVQSWLLDENNRGRHGLKECTLDHLGRSAPTFEQTFGKLPPKKKDKKTGEVIVTKTTGDLIEEALALPPMPVPPATLPTTYVSAESAAAYQKYQQDVAAYEAAQERFFRAVDYSSLDAYDSTVLRECLDEKLRAIVMYHKPDGTPVTLFDYYYQVEVPFTKVLWKMERRGVTVDAGFLWENKEIMEAEMRAIHTEFTKAASYVKGEPYVMNLSSSSPDSKWFFYEAMKKPVTQWTDGGKSGNKQPALDGDILEDWAGEGDAWANLLLRYREIDKIYGTYVKGLSKHQDQSYRIHTTLNQTGTVTGRLSSSEPNLQNIPRPSEDRFKIRDSFIPGEGKILLVADYAQLEMRLMAHFSQDEKMVNAIRNKVDLHCLTTSEMEGIPYDDVLAAVKAEKNHKAGLLGRELLEREIELCLKRQNNKSTGFGIIYGIGGPRLAAKLTRETGKYLSPREGIDLIQKWLAVFPGVREYIERTKAYVRQYGKVQTITGRWRRFGDLKSMTKGDAAQAERQAVNSIVQGSAADLAKAAMLKCEYDEELNSYGVELLMQIHDELMFEMPYENEDNVEKAMNRIKDIMEHPFDFDLLVPLPAEPGKGYSWSSAK